MDILPAIDLMAGRVVRGNRGLRACYRPIRSSICSDSTAQAVAAAFRDRFDLQRLYLADLDAIDGKPPALDVFRELVASGYSLAVDAGLSAADDAVSIAQAGVSTIVAGLESLKSPMELQKLVRVYSDEHVLFSLDMYNGRLIAASDDWPSDSPEQTIELVIRNGIRQILVLDLSRVGSSLGLGTLSLVNRMRQMHPMLRVYVGGGVRDVCDLDAAADSGADGVVISSALHDGRVTPTDVARWVRRAPDTTFRRL